MGEFEINILPFNILNEQVEVSFSQNEKEGYFRIHKNNLPKNFPAEIREALDKFAWWTTTSQNGDTIVPVSLTENERFAKYYFNKILFGHFYNLNIITNRNFINDTEVYLEDQAFHNNEYKKYHCFSLRFDNNSLIEGTSLLVTYEGDSFILGKSVRAAQLNNSVLGKVRYHGKIAKFKLLGDNERADTNNIYPLLNRDIKFALKIPFERNYSENKYRKYYDLVHEFYDDYLKDVVIGDCIRIFGSGFYKPYEKKVNHTSQDSNLLLFGKNQKNFIPYVGLKENGPLEAPDQPVKFIFIFHSEDNGLANKVYSYFKKGYKSFPGLESFVKIQFEIDTARSLRFTADDPIEEITLAIQNLESNPSTAFRSDTRYVALYISRIRKDSEDEEIDKVYYRL
ncbi:MAG: hypothetical protein HY868_18380 [Chloroflexi bacterium]|nr:hypothetical protein [Chloroflexota bacterium]